MLIQEYEYGNGGIGDMLRSMLAYFSYCKENNIRYFIHFGDHPFNLCFKKQVIPVFDNASLFVEIGSKHSEKTKNFLNDIKDDTKTYIVKSNIFDFVSFDVLKKYRGQFIDFLQISDIIKNRISEIISKEYVSIHVRCGDAYMNYVNIGQDVRIKNTENVVGNILDISKNFIGMHLFLFSDNDNIKKYFTDHKEFGINCLNTKIHHTALKTNNDELNITGTIDSVSEFFIIGHSKKIIMLSDSGFPFWSAFIHDKPLYDKNLELFSENKLKY